MFKFYQVLNVSELKRVLQNFIFLKKYIRGKIMRRTKREYTVAG